MKTPSPIAYIGPTGADLGFKLAGIDTHPCDTGSELVTLLRTFRDQNTYKIIFIDEAIAADVYDEVERLNQQTVPALILISNPTNPHHVAKEKMDRLIIKALGADILNS